MSRIITFYDTEWTTWEGARENNWGESWQHRELVQIGAIRFNLDTLKEIEEFLVLVKPTKNPKLSNRFVELTGIKQTDVNQNGLSFSEAYRAFTAFISTSKSSCFGPDATVLRENLTLNNLPAGAEDFDSFNIRPWFLAEGSAYGITDDTNSGKLAQIVGAKMERVQEHNAMHDARSIAAAYRFLIGQGASQPSWVITTDQKQTAA